MNHLKFTVTKIVFYLEDIVLNDGSIMCYVTRKMNLLQHFSNSFYLTSRQLVPDPLTST
jgi:hypothetical protein